MARLAPEFRRQPIDDPLHREFLDFRRHGAGVEPADIQERIQQVGHRGQRVLLAVDHLPGALVLDGAAQRPVQQAQRLHGLSQVVTRGGKKRRVGFLRPLRRLARRNDLLLHAPPLGHVPDHAGNEHAARRLDRAEADLHGKFAAVLAATQQVEPRPHRPQLGIRSVTVAMLQMLFPDALRQQHFDLVAQQLGAGVAEHVFGLAIDDGYAAALVDDDHGVGRGLEHRAEVGFRFIPGIHLADRAGDEQTHIGADRRQRDFGTKAAAVLAQTVEIESRQQGPRPWRILVAPAILLVLIAQIRGHEHFHGFARHFLGRVPEQRLRAAVDEHDPAVAVRDDRGVGSSVQKFVDDLGGQPAGGHRGAHGNG